jgi:predicted RNase H-like HicB family nuclease
MKRFNPKHIARRSKIVIPVKLHLNLRKDEDGWYVVSCKELSAAITQGKTIKEAIKNGREAAHLVIEEILFGGQKRGK